MNEREFKNRRDVVTRLLSVLIDSLSNQTPRSTAFLKAVQFQSLSLNSDNPVLCLASITRYILFFLKSFRYRIDTIEYIYVIYIILEIFSRDVYRLFR